MRCLLAVLIIGPVLAACSSDKGLGETERVRSDDLGSAWPLTVDSALLTYDDATVLVQVEGSAFRIDDISGPGDAHSGFRRLWATDPEQRHGRRDLSPLVDAGRSLCD
ncbi:hypothetical protein [Nocardioides deserti]|uniref:DUF2511 domain-containing protein n=1 Tax=Nocardioides deserti TaxID=1588644 RepID=A0ABR6U5X6_9ACTN|nr:hypothetical protein [Nocardioides deserti]MBC2959246.1 hypothetical protein [Nocardioides deserti]GGO68273.1 hypothetical protein GCM10012276_01700 [Nocardioides deserti]